MLKGYKYIFLSWDIHIIEKNNKIYAITTSDNYQYIKEETKLIKQTIAQLNEYKDGKRKEFDIPLHLEGTPFQIKVWQELQKIPYGKTATYKDIAIRVGSPKAYRAIGNANNHNRIMIVIPCHRVIGADGKLVGYAGGLDLKETLLLLEKK